MADFAAKEWSHKRRKVDDNQILENSQTAVTYQFPHHFHQPLFLPEISYLLSDFFGLFYREFSVPFRENAFNLFWSYF